jgi:pterin-4a-carbinolamine dehydratase
MFVMNKANILPCIRARNINFLNVTITIWIPQQQRDQSSSVIITTPQKRIRTDPSAKRPNKICDPYGQGGKPLSLIEAKQLKGTISNQWQFEYTNDPCDEIMARNNASNEVSMIGSDHNDSDPHEVQQQQQNKKNYQHPIALVREFIHPDYLSGARFIQKIAAIAQMNNHYPTVLQLHRHIVQKKWHIVSICQCQTYVLGGLSRNDYHLAMVRITTI